MSKKNEDNIERFFRKAVTQNDTSFRESDWHNMEKMLDERDAKAAAIRTSNLRRAAYFLLILALIPAAVYWLMPGEKISTHPQEQATVTTAETSGTEAKKAGTAQQRATMPTQQTVAPSTQVNPGASADASLPVTQSKPGGSATLPADGHEVNKSSANATSSVAGKATSRPLLPANRQHAASPPETVWSKTKEKPETIHSNTGSPGRRSKTTGDVITTLDNNEQRPSSIHSTDPVAVRQQREAAVSTVLANTSTPNEKQGGAEHTDLVKSNDGQHQADQMKTPLQAENLGVKQPGENITSAGRQAERNSTVPSLSEEEQEKPPVKKEEPILSTDSVAAHTFKEEILPEKNTVPSRWNVALMVAPDFTSTAMEQYTAPGSAYGLTIGYRFYDRLTVSTGVIRSSKKYVGYGSDYQPPEGYWLRRTNGVVPDEIKGQCKIIEIPLMVQYRFRQRQHSHFYAATGISSYILMSEAYKYAFESPNPGAAQAWSSSESSTYPFAIGHLSLAYERNVLPWLGVGVEPFLKIPFGGIGWSNVNLYSTGLLINVRYNILKKDRKRDQIRAKVKQP